MRITVMSLKNLTRRRFRTSLCMFGVSLATIFIVAVGVTTTNYTTAIRKMNIFFTGDIVVVAEGSMVIQAFPVAGGNIPTSAVERVGQVNGVEKVVPMLVRFGYKVEAVIQLAPTNVTVGMPPEDWSVLVDHTPLQQGGNWPSADPETKEVVVGWSLAEQHGLGVGSEIRLEDTDLTVVGILDTRSTLLSRSIIMPLRLAQHLYYGHSMWVNMVVAQLEDEMVQEEVANNIEDQVLGLEALTTKERNEIVEPLLNDIEAWNMGIGSMLYVLSMVLVTVVAMMNVSERRRDFATLDAIGAPKNTVFRMVITETALIGLLGGAVGICLGSIVAVLVASFYTSVPLSLFFVDFFNYVSPSFMAQILVSTIAVSCLAGVTPALAALKVNVSQVLRSEY